MNRIVAGVLGGCVATAPMTIVMEWWHRRLPSHEQYALPPREITMEVAHETGLAPALDEPQRDALTLASHFTYGAACGAVYSAVAPRLPGPPLLKGALFGLGVWAISYLGWLPLLGVLRPAHQHPGRRNALMIGAHLVWGLVCGALVQALQSSEEE